MNRRQALKAMAGGVASFFLLEQRRHFDLAKFCGKSHRYEHSKPFWQDGHIFATDGKVCLRVGSHSGDVLGPECKLPPAATLPWGKDGEKVTQVCTRMAVAWCDGCDGTTLANRRKCPECGGEDEDEDEDYFDCTCMFGWVGDGHCIECEGHGEYAQPCLVEVTAGGNVQYFERELWDKVQSIGDVQVRLSSDAKYDSIACPVPFPAFLAFDGGDGLLMPMDKQATQRRLT